MFPLPPSQSVRLTRLVLSLILFMPVLFAQSQPDLEKGLDLAREGRFSEALAAFERHKRVHPDDPDGYHQTGLALAAMGRLEEAAAELGEAIRRRPDSVEIQVDQAHVLARLDQTQAAIAALSAIDHDNLAQVQDADACWLLSDLYYRSERWVDSLRVLQHYSLLRPQDVRIRLRQGQIYLLQNRLQESIAAFEAAISLRPDLAPAHHARGLAQWRAQQSARQSLAKAVELDPNNAGYRLDLGKYLLEQGEAQEAIVFLEGALSSGDPQAEVLFQLSRAYRRAGNGGRADEFLARFKEAQARVGSVEKAREASQFSVRRGQDHLQKGVVKEALSSFLKAVESDPQNWLAHSYLAKIYLSSGRLPEAARHLSAMEEIAPDSAEGSFLKATYLYRVRDYPRAASAAEKARTLRPDYGELRNLLGNIYTALQRRQDALKEYEAAVRLEPGRSDFRLNYEAALKKSKQ